MDAPHRRFNPLLNEWVLVSPQRLARPWLGRIEPPPAAKQPAYDSVCYLCPGNLRAGDVRNPNYEHTFVFDNDFPALLAGETSLKAGATPSELLVAQPERGICRVVCFSPRHDASIPCLSVEELSRVVDVWVEQFVALGALPAISYVQIFENRGASMGASNPHPHGQIWANETVPNLPAREGRQFATHRTSRGSCLLCDYLAAERQAAARIVCENDAFVAIVPFWAVWPFETMVLPVRHAAGIDELSAGERQALADILKRVTSRYDAMFSAACPYSMGFHQRPTGGDPHPEWHLHAHFYPPVLRSASVHKFMVGYELLAAPQRDLTPERAAAIFREAAGDGHD